MYKFVMSTGAGVAAAVTTNKLIKPTGTTVKAKVENNLNTNVVVGKYP